MSWAARSHARGYWERDQPLPCGARHQPPAPLPAPHSVSCLGLKDNGSRQPSLASSHPPGAPGPQLSQATPHPHLYCCFLECPAAEMSSWRQTLNSHSHLHPISDALFSRPCCCLNLHRSALTQGGSCPQNSFVSPPSVSPLKSLPTPSPLSRLDTRTAGLSPSQDRLY